MNRNKLYILLLSMSLLGYAWIFIHFYRSNAGIAKSQVCIFKNITNLPCPSCGSTRSIVEIIKGDFSEALYINPLGFVGICFLIVTPLWLLFDVLQRKNTLYLTILNIENKIKRTPIAITLIILIIANWVWNIFKNL